MAKVRCNKCMSVFNDEDLPFEPDATDGEYTHVCPICHTDTELMDLDDGGDSE